MYTTISEQSLDLLFAVISIGYAVYRKMPSRKINLLFAYHTLIY